MLYTWEQLTEIRWRVSDLDHALMALDRIGRYDPSNRREAEHGRIYAASQALARAARRPERRGPTREELVAAGQIDLWR